MSKDSPAKKLEDFLEEVAAISEDQEAANPPA